MCLFVWIEEFSFCEVDEPAAEEDEEDQKDDVDPDS